MKAAIYCRTSKIDQNPENQLIDLERYSKAMGYEYEIFQEQESTRKTRPIKQQVFQDTIGRKYDIIIVWKLDRWARSLQELINDLQVLQVNKAEFFSLKDNIKLDGSATNMLMIQVLGAFAEFERAIIRERTLAGLQRARANGVILGRPAKKTKAYMKTTLS